MSRSKRASESLLFFSRGGGGDVGVGGTLGAGGGLGNGGGGGGATRSPRPRHRSPAETFRSLMTRARAAIVVARRAMRMSGCFLFSNSSAGMIDPRVDGGS